MFTCYFMVLIESVLRRFYGKGESRKIASLIRNNPQIAGMWCCIFATGRGFPATSVRFYAAKENSSWQGFLSYWYYIRKNSLWWNGVGWGRKAWCKNATLKNSILWKKYFKNSLHKLELSEKTPNPSWREYFFKECMCPKRPQTGIW